MRCYSTIELEIDLIRALLNGNRYYSKTIKIEHNRLEAIEKIEDLIHQYHGQVDRSDDGLKLSVDLVGLETVEEEYLLNRLKELENLENKHTSELASSSPEYISDNHEHSPFPSYIKKKQKRNPSDQIHTHPTAPNDHDFEGKSNKLVEFFQVYVDKRIDTYYQRFDTEMHQMRNEINDIKTLKNDLFDRISKRIDIEFKKQITTLLKFERQLYKKQLDHLKSQLVSQIGEVDKRVDGLYSKSELDHKLYALKEVINNFIHNHSNQIDTELIDIDDYLQFFEPLNLTEQEISSLVDDIIDQSHIGQMVTSDANEEDTLTPVNTNERNIHSEFQDNSTSSSASQNSAETDSVTKLSDRARSDEQSLLRHSNEINETINNNPLNKNRSKQLETNSNYTGVLENKNANRFNSLYKRQPISQDTAESLTQTIDDHKLNKQSLKLNVDINAGQIKNQANNESDISKVDDLVESSIKTGYSELKTHTEKMETIPSKLEDQKHTENTYNNNLISLKQADPTTIRRPKRNNPNNVKFVRLSKQGYFDDLPFKK